MYKVNRYDCSRKFCIITNLGCNLHCTYCYQHKNQEKIFNVEETLHKIVPVLSKKTQKGTIIKMLGGEPFLVFDRIKDMCERIWAMDLPESYLFHTTSNGTLIHGNIQTWLERHHNEFTVKLSLDGNKTGHNINRPGSFDKIDLDFFKTMWPDVGIKMTISPESIKYLFDSVVFLHEFGFKTIKTNFAELVNWRIDGLYKSFYQQMSRLKDYYLRTPSIEPCALFKIPFRRCTNKTTKFHQCTIGERIIIDCNTGNNYPCVFFLPSVCGEKISEDLIKLDMTKDTNLVSEFCFNCPFLNICKTCYAANYMQRGDTAQRDLSICELHKICFAISAQFLIGKYVYQKAPLGHGKRAVQTFKDLEAVRELYPHVAAIQAKYE